MRPYHKQLISKLAKMCISRSLLFWLISFQDNRSYAQLEKLTHLTHSLTTWVSALTITHSTPNDWTWSPVATQKESLQSSLTAQTGRLLIT